MTKICIFLASTLFSYIGWELGAGIGCEMFGCLVISGLGSCIGIFVGWKFGQKYS